MAEVTLKAVRRQATGKGAARRARAANKVPGVVYGRGMDPVPVEVDRRDLVAAFHTDAGMNVLLNIELDGSSTTTLTKELQRDPVRGTLLHADFVKVDLTIEVEVEVPVHIVGEARGAKEGGILEQPLFQLQVKCLPTEVPESIDADVSDLGIGDSLKVGDLAVERTFEILTDAEMVVATVAAPITEEQLEAMEAAVAEAPAEPEVEEEEAPAPAEGIEEGAEAAAEAEAPTEGEESSS
jgi:large subunit ribosomal protein L25